MIIIALLQFLNGLKEITLKNKRAWQHVNWHIIRQNSLRMFQLSIKLYCIYLLRTNVAIWQEKGKYMNYNQSIDFYCWTKFDIIDASVFTQFQNISFLFTLKIHYRILIDGTISQNKNKSMIVQGLGNTFNYPDCGNSTSKLRMSIISDSDFKLNQRDLHFL